MLEKQKNAKLEAELNGFKKIFKDWDHVQSDVQNLLNEKERLLEEVNAKITGYQKV
jgi:hypothetical protein